LTRTTVSDRHHPKELRMAGIVYFTIQADDIERAAAFYSKTFGWEIEKWGGTWAGTDEYWLINTGTAEQPGLAGTLMKRPGPVQSPLLNGFMCGIQSTSIDADIQAVAGNGGSLLSPKVTIPGVGWVAYCRDTEGNFFELRHMDPSAA
jgi:predicted enzyme related to lactoylglutathione lyase